jgi:hypothetical protein
VGVRHVGVIVHEGAEMQRFYTRFLASVCPTHSRLASYVFYGVLIKYKLRGRGMYKTLRPPLTTGLRPFGFPDLSTPRQAAGNKILKRMIALGFSDNR